MKHLGPAIHYCLATLALGALISVAPALAQSPNPTPANRDTDLSQRQLGDFDRFLDAHPEISEQLRKDPSLMNNQEFVSNHADLKQYLQDHPEVREALTQNPSAVMHQEQRFDRREDQTGDQDRDGRSHDITRGELANMDDFMDRHPEIAEQLRKNPALIDNKEFVQNHPALQEFLANHPGVREEYKENPTAFMRQEEHFDRREDSMRGDRDVTRGELSSFHEFLQSHGNISDELVKNPSLATNQEYLENHPALRDYLQANPKVHEELGENPQSFLSSAQQFGGAPKAPPKPITDPKVK